MKPKILVAEPEEMFAEAIRYILERAGFDAVTAHDSLIALERAHQDHPNLCILSADLAPVTNSYLCCDLRKESGADFKAPILMIGTDPSEETRVSMLDCGVDDYMVKPFDMREFIARLYALLRRSKVPLEMMAGGQLRVGKFFLDFEKRSLTVEGDPPATFSMTLKESQVLFLLMSNAGSVVRRETIFANVWGQVEGQSDTSNCLDVNIRTLRQKIEKNVGKPEHITSIRNVGIVFHA